MSEETGKPEERVPADAGFEVVDRRRVRAPEETASAGAEPAEPAAPAAEEEEAPAGTGLPALTVAGMVEWMLGVLAEKAWASMGLIPDPLSGRISRDLAEAKRAIDVAADLVKHLSADAAPPEQREMQTLLSDLRINYVKQSGQA